MSHLRFDRYDSGHLRREYEIVRKQAQRWRSYKCPARVREYFLWAMGKKGPTWGVLALVLKAGERAMGTRRRKLTVALQKLIFARE